MDPRPPTVGERAWEPPCLVPYGNGPSRSGVSAQCRTLEWDETTLPAGLRRAHCLADRTWGRIAIRTGRLCFRAATAPVIDVELKAGSMQAIPPGVEHQVETVGPVLVCLEILAVERSDQPAAQTANPEGLESPDPGGDPACWAALVCPECGAVAGDEAVTAPDAPTAPLVSEADGAERLQDETTPSGVNQLPTRRAS